MKSFTVVWRQTALDQLAEIWLVAADREQINRAVEAIDGLLSTEPTGEFTRELAEGLRTVTVTPLRVIYSVQAPDCLVDIATVRLA